MTYSSKSHTHIEISTCTNCSEIRLDWYLDSRQVVESGRYDTT